MKNPVYQLVLFVLLLTAATEVQAQKQRCECDTTGRRQMATVMPEYPGGQEQMIKDLNTLMDLPADLQARGMVRFVINCRGHLCQPHMQSRIGIDVDSQLMKALGEMPAWSPGFMGDTPIDVSYSQVIWIKDGRVQLPEKR